MPLTTRGPFFSAHINSNLPRQETSINPRSTMGVGVIRRRVPVTAYQWLPESYGTTVKDVSKYLPFLNNIIYHSICIPDRCILDKYFKYCTMKMSLSEEMVNGSNFFWYPSAYIYIIYIHQAVPAVTGRPFPFRLEHPLFRQPLPPRHPFVGNVGMEENWRKWERRLGSTKSYSTSWVKSPASRNDFLISTVLSFKNRQPLQSIHFMEFI